MKNVVDLNLLAEGELFEWSHGKHYAGATGNIAEMVGAKFMGLRISILLPQKYSCPYHSHTKDEEGFLVLKGSATLRHDNGFDKVVPGQLAYFLTGENHQFYNHSLEPFVYLIFANKSKGDTCHYPDSNKSMAIDTRTITQEGKQVSDYWQGEENPGKFWPSKVT